MADRIALVDDDQNILTSVSLTLESEGFEVDCYHDGEAALVGLSRRPANLGVFDIKMPRMDGMELLQKVRGQSQMPVIFLTSKDDELDEALGLGMGADDYITKPFSQRLLLARIRAVLRRASDGVMKTSGPNIIRLGELLMDPDRHLCSWRGTEVKLTVTEFLILQALASRPGMVKTVTSLWTLLMARVFFWMTARSTAISNGCAVNYVPMIPTLTRSKRFMELAINIKHLDHKGRARPMKAA